MIYLCLHLVLRCRCIILVSFNVAVEIQTMNQIIISLKKSTDRTTVRCAKVIELIRELVIVIISYRVIKLVSKIFGIGS